jgi:hypothetical protein
MTAKTSLAELAVGDTIRWGCWVDDGTTTTVVGADAERIQVLNPDAGRIFGNRNRSPETFTYKRTSKRLAALTGLAPAKR